MTVLADQAFLGALLFGAVTAAMPMLLAGLGEQMSERAGVMNIGLEGMMLGGAFAGFITANATGSLWLGLLAGSAAGGALAALVAVLCVRLGLEQVVIGVGITLGAQGLTSLLHQILLARTQPRLPAPDIVPVPILADLPVIGPGLFQHHALVYVGVALVCAMGLVYRHLIFGLQLAAAGEKPEALDAAGVDVVRVRTGAVLAAGALSGLGGAYLSEIAAGVFVPFMTNGTGFLGIVLAMLAGGRPFLVLCGALVFGTCLSMATALQVVGVRVPSEAIQMLPFLAVMLLLILVGHRSSLPSVLGAAYVRGSRET